MSSLPSDSGEACPPMLRIPPRPEPKVSFSAQGVPEALRAIPRWVLWEYRFVNDNWTKVPIDAKTGRNAACNDPATWTDFDRAVASSGRFPNCAGLGIVFDGTDALLGIDLDDCVDDQGRLSPEALQLVRRVDSYTEYSPSGTGVKLFAIATKPTPRCTTSKINGIKKVEIYDRGRFFTVTGTRVPGCPAEPQPRHTEVDRLCAELFPPELSGTMAPTTGIGFSGDDLQLVDKIRASRQGAKFWSLMQGDTGAYNGDDSSADLALCSILAFWCGNDPSRIDQIFRQSGLYRAKWERDDYRNLTISKAIAGRQEFYEPMRVSRAGGSFHESPQESANVPEIMLGTDEHRVVDEVIAALTVDPELYQREDKLVRIIAQEADRPEESVSRPAGAATIAFAGGPFLRERVTKNVRLLKKTRSGASAPAHPPNWLVPEIEARGSWNGMRRLVGISSTPVLRSDGSVWTQPGYDAQTGIVFRPQCSFPEMPDSPTQMDARAAAGSLEKVVCDFAFESEAHRSVWMAGVITPIARSAFDGPSPLFLFDANVRGAGKTLLAQSVGGIALGRDLGVSNYSADPEELRKQITAIVIAGDPAILFDNLQGGIGGSTLDRMLTATHWSDRVLGTNMTVNLPLRTTWYGTGNNVMLHGDTCRRTLHCRLEVLDQNPEDRGGFTHPDLLAWIRRERGRLVMAAVTIVAAYLKAGRPCLGLKPMGSFDGWSEVVRNALVWAGCPDPCNTRDGLASMADSDTLALGSLLDTLDRFDHERSGFIVSELIARCWGQNGVLGQQRDDRPLLGGFQRPGHAVDTHDSTSSPPGTTPWAGGYPLQSVDGWRTRGCGHSPTCAEGWISGGLLAATPCNAGGVMPSCDRRGQGARTPRRPRRWPRTPPQNRPTPPAAMTSPACSTCSTWSWPSTTRPPRPTPRTGATRAASGRSAAT